LQRFHNSGWRAYAGILACLVFLVAAKPTCAPTDNAREFELEELRLVAGECTELPGLLEDGWDRLSRAVLCDTLSTVWLEVVRRPEGTRLRMCADLEIGFVTSDLIYMWFTTTDDSAYAVTYDISTGDTLNTSITATVNPVSPGSPTLLQMNVSGGMPPYEYLWSYDNTLSSPLDGPSIVARPTIQTFYYCRVTDNVGNKLWANITIDVTARVVQGDPR